MTEQITPRAREALDLFQQLLNGGEVTEEHELTRAGALVYGKAMKRLTGKAISEPWEYFRGMTVAELHEEFKAMEDMPKPVLKEYLVKRAKGEA